MVQLFLQWCTGLCEKVKGAVLLFVQCEFFLVLTRGGIVVSVVWDDGACSLATYPGDKELGPPLQGWYCDANHR
jgi:hypothetical protein